MLGYWFGSPRHHVGIADELLIDDCDQEWPPQGLEVMLLGTPVLGGRWLHRDVPDPGASQPPRGADALVGAIRMRLQPVLVDRRRIE